MRKVVIESSQRTTLRLVGTGEGESGSALSPFGPLKVGLITMQKIDKEVPLTELLSSLERKITELNFKSYEALNILTLAMAPLAKHTSSSSNTTITDI